MTLLITSVVTFTSRCSFVRRLDFRHSSQYAVSRRVITRHNPALITLVVTPFVTLASKEVPLLRFLRKENNQVSESNLENMLKTAFRRKFAG